MKALRVPHFLTALLLLLLVPQRHPTRYLRLAAALLLTALVVGWPATESRAAQQAVVTVMTQNMDAGTDFGFVLGAQSLQQLEDGGTATYQEVQASNIPERAQAVAREIGEQHPDVVGLQEVPVWRTGPFGQPPATNVQFDGYKSLLDALKQQGLPYTPVASMNDVAPLNEFDLEGPTSSGFDIRYTDQEVILARTGPNAPTLSNIQKHHYATILHLPTILGTVPITRGWISVEVTIGGHTFRFVNTHLEEASATVQVAQGNELVQGPGTTSLPVVFAGDFNSNAGCGSSGKPQNQTQTYGNLITAGFVDAWSATNPDDPGCTWQLHGEDPFTAASTPTDRIDLVLSRNGVRSLDAQLVGNHRGDLTPSGLWPSDHAGVVATLGIP